MNIWQSQWYSGRLNRDMRVRVYGNGGDSLPLLIFPTQDGMCDNWEGFGLTDTISDYVDRGELQLFAVDSVDQDSWSAVGQDCSHRAWVQEQYYQYIIEEVLPFIRIHNGSGNLPVAAGCSMGATHAVICFLRRPDLFGGTIAMSGVYDADYFFDGYMDETLYQNSPTHFMPNLPADHPYIALYNRRFPVICVGQGAWEDDGIRTQRALEQAFREKGINAWFDYWGYDVNHDWPWWKKQIRYFLPEVLKHCRGMKE